MATEYWIRDGSGDVFGPMSYATVELFVENGMFKPPMDASSDGMQFVPPGEMNDLRNAFPQRLWGTSGGTAESASAKLLNIGSGPRLRIPTQPPAPSVASTDHGRQNTGGVPPIGDLFGSGAAAFTPAPVQEPPPGPLGPVGPAGMDAFATMPPPAVQPGIGRLPFSGSITFDLPPLCLCHRAVSEKATGLLTLDNGTRTYCLFFQKGVLESVTSTRPDESLASFALTQKKITEEQLEVVQAEGGDELEAILRLGILPAPTAMELLTQHRMSLLFKAILLFDGGFTFNADMRRPSSAQALGEGWTPLCQAARAIPKERILQGLGNRIDRHVMPSGGQQNVDIGQMSLNAMERRILSKFDGTKTLVELCDTMPDAQALPVLRTAYLLTCFEIISFSSEVIHTVSSAGFHRRFLRSDRVSAATGQRLGSSPGGRFGSNPESRFGSNPESRFGSNPGGRLGSNPPVARQGTPSQAPRFGSGIGFDHAGTTPPPSSLPRIGSPLPPQAPGFGKSPPPPRFASNPGVDRLSTPAPFQRMGTPASTPSVPPRFGSNPGADRLSTPAPSLRIGTPTSTPQPRFGSNPGVDRLSTPAPSLRIGTPTSTPQPRFATNHGVERVTPQHHGAPASSQRFGSKPEAERQKPPMYPRFGTHAPVEDVSVSLGGEAEKLKKMLQDMKDKNHFEVLGVSQDATGSAFKLAFFKLAKTYHPDTAVGAAPEISQLKSSIFSRLNEAYQTLDNPKSRQEYIDTLKGDGGKVDVAAVLAAEEKYMKASLLLKGRRYKEALPLVEEAISLNPQEGEFVAARGFVNFMIATDKMAAKASAVEEIHKALTISPKCAEAHFFMGQIEKMTGNTAAAKESFNAVLAISPKHLEAQREIRWLGQKK